MKITNKEKARQAVQLIADSIREYNSGEACKVDAINNLALGMDAAAAYGVDVRISYDNGRDMLEAHFYNVEF